MIRYGMSPSSRPRLLPRLAFVLLLVAETVSAAAPPMDEIVLPAMRQAEVPGMAVAVVENGSAPFVRAYGVRKLGRPEKVDEHTVFEIGSCAKAFVAVALALLVEEGRLAWHDRVADRLPGFRLYDGFATLEMTVIDLLVHNSGLGTGAGDLLFFPPTELTRAQIVERLRHIRPVRSFRSGFAYDNVLYIAAERLVEVLSGSSWEQFVRQRLFEPLGMRDAVASPAELRSRNFGWPHGRISGPLRGVGPLEPLASGADFGDPAKASLAGSIMASASDMVRWLQLLLNEGQLPDGPRLYGPDSARELWEPRILMPITPRTGAAALATPNFQAYALGWMVQDYRGHRIVMHTGATDGALAVVGFVPDRGVGIAILMNSEDGEVLRAVFHQLLDHYLELPPHDWLAAFSQERSGRVEQALAQLRQPQDEARGPGPSLPLARYAGKYRDAWYGTITITEGENGLRIRFDHTRGMVGDLEHVRHDTFRTRWSDRSIEDAYVTFSLNPDGSIERIRMQAISPLADFSFDYHDLLFVPESSESEDSE